MEVTLEVDKMDKLIITVATTGGIHTKSVNPNLPEQPDEMAQEAYDCYNAGAAIHHIHVRDEQGRTTGDLAKYGEVISKVKAKCPIITQIGNGIGGVYDSDGSFRVATQEERLALTTIEPKPDMLTINAGTFQFGYIPDVFFDTVHGVLGHKKPFFTGKHGCETG